MDFYILLGMETTYLWVFFPNSILLKYKNNYEFLLFGKGQKW